MKSRLFLRPGLLGLLGLFAIFAQPAGVLAQANCTIRNCGMSSGTITALSDTFVDVYNAETIAGAKTFSAATTFSTSVEVGASGTAVTQMRVYSETITPAYVAANVCAEQTFTVTGLTTADKVFINPVATGNATSAGQVRVSAANTLAVTYCNPTAGALTPAVGTMNIVAIRS